MFDRFSVDLGWILGVSGLIWVDLGWIWVDFGWILGGLGMDVGWPWRHYLAIRKKEFRDEFQITVTVYRRFGINLCNQLQYAARLLTPKIEFDRCSIDVR